jgi:hypothetical protein
MTNFAIGPSLYRRFGLLAGRKSTCVSTIACTATEQNVLLAVPPRQVTPRNPAKL